jgi:hypothetical protein
MSKKCKQCHKKILVGRSDKIFCSIKCKNFYHKELRKKTNKVAIEIDEILHRNRSILYELLGDSKKQLTINRVVLEMKKFRFKYHTHYHINKQGKTYFWVYDFAWMEFSNDAVLVLAKKT